MIRSATIACSLLLAATGVAVLPCPVAAQTTGPRIAADPVRYATEHHAAGRVDAAIVTLRRALDREPGSAELHAKLGYVLRYAGLTDRSIAEYRRAARLDPSLDSRVRSASQIAKALIHAGDYPGAAREQAEAAELLRKAGAPLDEKMRFYEGVVALSSGRPEDAVRAFDAAVATGRETVWTQFARGYRFVATSDTAGAKAVADELLGTPDVADGERRYRLVHLYAAAGDVARANAILSSVVATNFFNPSALEHDPLLTPLRGSTVFDATRERARERMEAVAESTRIALPPQRYVLVIHGGGGVRPKDEMTPEHEAAYRAALAHSLEVGNNVLAAGGTAVDAVEAAIRVMEDSSLFNAGKGASFNRAGFQEMDSSIMDGRTLKAGGAAIVQHVRNPISLARRVMENSPHVLMAADGAEAFAREQGLELVPAHYFFTDRKWESLQERLRLKTPYGGTDEGDNVVGRTVAAQSLDWKVFGTVGAVALDGWGDLAAGTSTGGREGKLPGRIGDSPIIGAGTYADNRTLAVSSTGLGEYVMRLVSAKDIADRMAYAGWPLDRATQNAVDDIVAMGGGIGLIAVDAAGNVAMPFGGDGMYRGVVREDGAPQVWIYKQ